MFAARSCASPPKSSRAIGPAAAAIITTLTVMNAAVTALELEQRINQDFEHYPDAAICCSVPALGPILSARVLGEFGDDPARWPDPASRRAYTSISTDFREIVLFPGRALSRRRCCSAGSADHARWLAKTEPDRG